MPEIFNAKKLAPTKDKHYKNQPFPHEVNKHKLVGHSHNPLSAFSYYPDHIKFIGADKEERIVLLLRRHPITNIKWLFMALLLLLTPFVLSFFPELAFLPANYQLIALLFWYLITLAFVLEKFLSWFFNVYIVTDERVFDVDFINLVYREITDANIDQIQDVTVRVGSVIRTMFDYGDLIIQTAAEIPQIEFDAVPHPDRVAQVLRELRVEEEQEKLEGRVR
jgi:uncharacterized membrane protein YdbT with pleckstrin-like domain